MRKLTGKPVKDPAAMAAVLYDKAARLYNENDRAGLRSMLLLKNEPSYELPVLDMAPKTINFSPKETARLLKIESEG